MQSNASLSRKDTLVAFRVAAKDVEFLKKSAEDDYKDGEIKAPSLAALAKHLLYRHLRMLKDLEKARLWRAQQPRNLHNGTPAVEESNLETADLNYFQNDDYDDDYGDEGSLLKRPFFYELFPDWKERITRLSQQ